MTDQTFLILGGTGNAGFSLAHSLLKETDLSLIITSRDKEKAHFTAGELNACALKDDWRYRVTGIALDPNNQAALRDILAKVDVVIVAAAGIDTAILAEVLIETKTNCIDIRENPDKHRILQRFVPQFIENNIFYLADAGIFPGTSAILMRYLLAQMPHADQAFANVLIRMNWQKYQFSQTTVKDFVEILQNTQNKVWKQPHWKKAGWWRDFPQIKFPQPFGSQTCAPMVLPEMTQLVENYPQLKYAGVRIAGFNPVVDYLLMPLLQWTTFPLAKPLEWALKKFSKPPFGTYLQAEISGIENNRRQILKATLFHEDAYELTAAAISAVVLQYLKENKTAGLHLQGLWANPIDFIEQLKKLGATFQTEKYFI
ncbi:MAG: hypothetical protein RIT27_2367 [Pseudomonadota bacterium]|jgi:hypothetical protein